MNVLSKLLWRKSHRLSAVVAGIGLAIGLWILLMSIQGFFDFKEITKGEDSALITVNKSVGLLNSLGMKNTFNSEELTALTNLEGVNKVAAFQSNDFKVSIRSPRLGFYTEIFFEALPEEFLEGISEDFNWSPSSNIVPIVLPKQYISLYNFGFAPSQGLPQVSPSLIQRFTFDIEIRGFAANANFKGKIIDLTDKANTILVPQDFLTWANKKYGSGNNEQASRLAVLSQPDKLPLVRQAIEKEGFEINSNQLIGERTGLVVQLVLLFVLLIGLIFILLAGFLVYQAMKSLISESRLEIRRLFEFGKSPIVLSKYFTKISLRTVLIGFVTGIGLFFVSQFLLKNWISNQGLTLSFYPHWVIIFLIAIIGVLFYTLIIRGTKSQLQSIFP